MFWWILLLFSWSHNLWPIETVQIDPVLCSKGYPKLFICLPINQCGGSVGAWTSMRMLRCQRSEMVTLNGFSLEDCRAVRCGFDCTSNPTKHLTQTGHSFFFCSIWVWNKVLFSFWSNEKFILLPHGRSAGVLNSSVIAGRRNKCLVI